MRIVERSEECWQLAGLPHSYQAIDQIWYWYCRARGPVQRFHPSQPHRSKHISPIRGNGPGVDIKIGHAHTHPTGKLLRAKMDTRALGLSDAEHLTYKLTSEIYEPNIISSKIPNTQITRFN